MIVLTQREKNDEGRRDGGTPLPVGVITYTVFETSEYFSKR